MTGKPKSSLISIGELKVSGTFTAFLTGLVGTGSALGGAYLNNKFSMERLTIELHHSSREREKEFKRERLEELYSLVNKWLHNMFLVHTHIANAINGQMTIDEADKAAIDSPQLEKIDFSRIHMLINMYFPQLDVQFSELLSKRDEISEIRLEHKKMHGSSAAKSSVDTKTVFFNLWEEFGNIGDRMKDKISKQAHDI